jgi:hypothetical protein
MAGLTQTSRCREGRWRLDSNLQVLGRNCGMGSSYQTVIAIAIARRVVVLPATASQPLSRSALKATLVLRTVTCDFASQSLTCLSTMNLCVPVKVLTFIA